MSIANPAAIAAPRAVVSCMDGRSTGMPIISAWDCLTSSLSKPRVAMGNDDTHLHADVRVAHSAIHGEL